MKNTFYESHRVESDIKKDIRRVLSVSRPAKRSNSCVTVIKKSNVVLHKNKILLLSLYKLRFHKSHLSNIQSNKFIP